MATFEAAQHLVNVYLLSSEYLVKSPRKPIRSLARHQRLGELIEGIIET